LTDKILIWIDQVYTQFGIAKFLKNIMDCKFFGIIDINEGKNFFKNQKLLDFEKVWFYRDFVTLNNKVDLEYLANFEKKYDIDIWRIIYSDVHMNKYNRFYQFNSDNILSIIEQQIKLFEKIIEETKPDFLIIRTTDYAKNQILHELCRVKKIPILTLGHTRLGTKCIITEENDLLDDHQKTTEFKINTNYSLEQLQMNLKIYSKWQTNMVKTYQVSSLKKISAILHFFTLLLNSNYGKYYEHKGWNLFNLIKHEFSIFFKKRMRKFFMNKHSIKNILFNEKYVYFPLQFEPERSILIASPFYANQLEIIKNIARSVPIDYNVYVKEHPSQSISDWRKIGFYQELLQIPNVKLIDLSVSSLTLVKNSNLVATVTGTVGLEAAFLQKPSIVFGDSIYSDLSCVHRIKNMNKLPEIIKLALKDEVNLDELQKFMNIIDHNSFEYDINKMNLEIDSLFHFDGFLKDSKIDTKTMSTFLNDNKEIFLTLANEHKKKIMIYKNFKEN
jgi:hypothetical protein